jgi:hypothetical protein
MTMGESRGDFNDTLKRQNSIFYRVNKMITQSHGYLAQETITFQPTVKRKILRTQWKCEIEDFRTAVMMTHVDSFLSSQ